MRWRCLLRTAGQGVLEPVWHELLTLELPVLAIAGARDDGYVRAAQPDRRHGARTRSAQIVENAGHAPQLQQPAAGRPRCVGGVSLEPAR